MRKQNKSTAKKTCNYLQETLDAMFGMPYSTPMDGAVPDRSEKKCNSEVPVKDFQIFFGDFNSTEISVTALTEAGREWLGDNFFRCAGVAPTGVGLLKSQGQDFLYRIADAGLSYTETHTQEAA